MCYNKCKEFIKIRDELIGDCDNKKLMKYNILLMLLLVILLRTWRDD